MNIKIEPADYSPTEIKCLLNDSQPFKSTEDITVKREECDDDCEEINELLSEFENNFELPLWCKLSSADPQDIEPPEPKDAVPTDRPSDVVHAIRQCWVKMERIDVTKYLYPEPKPKTKICKKCKKVIVSNRMNMCIKFCCCLELKRRKQNLSLSKPTPSLIPLQCMRCKFKCKTLGQLRSHCCGGLIKSSNCLPKTKSMLQPLSRIKSKNTWHIPTKNNTDAVQSTQKEFKKIKTSQFSRRHNTYTDSFTHYSQHDVESKLQPSGCQSGTVKKEMLKMTVVGAGKGGYNSEPARNNLDLESVGLKNIKNHLAVIEANSCIATEDRVVQQHSWLPVFQQASLVNQPQIGTVVQPVWPIQCYLCDSVWDTAELLMAHLEWHKHGQGKIKPYMPPPNNIYNCDECNQQYSNLDEFVAHLEKHRIPELQSNLNRCWICNAGFPTKTNMLRHVSVAHGHINPYRCAENDCKEVFSAFGQLHKHIREAHPVMKVICQFNECAQKFKNKKDYRAHCFLAHPEIKDYCPGCEEGFTVHQEHVCKLSHKDESSSSNKDCESLDQFESSLPSHGTPASRDSMDMILFTSDGSQEEFILGNDCVTFGLSSQHSSQGSIDNAQDEEDYESGEENNEGPTEDYCSD